MQLFRKGHYNVKLDREAWDRLITWIDINVPAYGTFHEIASIPSDFEKRRYECKKKYAGVDEDIEAIPVVERAPVAFVQPPPVPPRPQRVTLPGWPFTTEQAKSMQAAGARESTTLTLGAWGRGCNSNSVAFRRAVSSWERWRGMRMSTRRPSRPWRRGSGWGR